MTSLLKLLLSILLLWLVEEPSQDDVELNLSMLGRGEGGEYASGMLSGLKEAALAVMDCSMVNEAAD